MKWLWLFLTALFIQPCHAKDPVPATDCVEEVLRAAGFTRLGLEVELKYSLSKADSLKLRSVLGDEGRLSQFKTYYFDTPSQILRALDLNLRLRLNDEEAVRTAAVKAKPGIRIPKKGLPRKRRWEAEYDLSSELASELIEGTASWASALPVKTALVDLGVEEIELQRLKPIGFVETARSTVAVAHYPNLLFDQFTLNGTGEEFYELEVEADFDEMLRSHAFVLGLMAFHHVEYSPELHSKRTRLLDALSASASSSDRRPIP